MAGLAPSGATLTLGDSCEILTIAIDVSDQGATLIAERHAIPSDVKTGIVDYEGETKFARIESQKIVDEDYVELDLCWDESAPVQDIKPRDIQNHVIFVRPSENGEIELEQIRDDGQSKIEVTEEQLRKIIELLSIDGSPIVDTHMQLDSDCQVCRFEEDHGFCIQRNGSMIFGSGDIRFFLHPV